MASDPLQDALAGVLTPIVRNAVAEALETQQAPHAAEPAPALLTAVQLCNQLQVSKQTLNRLVQLGLPRVFVLESPRYDLGEVIAWLRARSMDL